MQKKGKVRVCEPTTKAPYRDENGVMHGMFDSLKQSQRQAVIKAPDVLKPVTLTTDVCLYCRTFSKGSMPTCNLCKRPLLPFGKNVKKVPKGNKSKWKKFVEAYAYTIWFYCKHLLPDHDLEHRMRIRGSIRSYNKDQAFQMNLTSDLQAWAKKLDRLLESDRK